jgi:hypothetical protein
MLYPQRAYDIRMLGRIARSRTITFHYRKLGHSRLNDYSLKARNKPCVMASVMAPNYLAPYLMLFKGFRRAS